MLDPVGPTERQDVTPLATLSRTLDGRELLSAFRAATDRLASHVEDVNRLNVYPVPDGDTGSNMLATVRSALAEADRIGARSRSPGVGRIASALAAGALVGARGNSGVILSQILGGIADRLAGTRRATGTDVAAGLTQGSKRARAAVARPVDGTILTVIRKAAAAGSDAAGEADDVGRVLGAAVEAARLAVARTPAQLAVLREAGVVDAGGEGLALILEGLFDHLRGGADDLPGAGTPFLRRRPIAEPGAPIPFPPSLRIDHGYGLETVFLLRARPGSPLDPEAIRSGLERIAESVVVAGDRLAVKVHVHGERPDDIVAFARTRGIVSDLSVEDLDRQTAALDLDVEGHLLGLRAAPTIEHARPFPVGAPSRAAIALLALVPGDGFAAAFRSFGTRTFRTGPSGSASVDDLAAAIEVSSARIVVLLANDPDAIPGARRAAAIAGRATPATRVHVLPTRNAAEGLAAVIAFDPGRSSRENLAAMSKAAGSVRTFRVPDEGGRPVALAPDGEILAAGADPECVVTEALAHLHSGIELVTIYHGAGVERPDAEALGRSIVAARPGTEIVLVDGGQPNDRYLISAE